jgi:hypothetical protein
MAAANPPQRQVAAFEDTVYRDSVLCVGGATGVKAAMIAHKGAEAGLVTSNNKNQQTTH